MVLVWASLISNLLVLSAEVTGAFGADADNQARGRLVLALALIAFGFWRVVFPLLVSNIKALIKK